MIKNFLLFLVSVLLVSCSNKKQPVDLIIHNAIIYTIDSSFSIQQAMAIKEGKIIETGSNEQILNSYSAKESQDVGGKTIFPGFIDAHCHFYGYGKGLQEIDLVGTKSFEEVLTKVKEFAVKTDQTPNPTTKAEVQWLVGRGWDQNDWETKEFPNKSKLDSLFPNIPVILTRVDGHAALVNQTALDIAKFSTKTKMSGGEVEIKNRKLTGILIDNAEDSLKRFISKSNFNTIKNALLNAQTNCFAMGLTTVDDAGLEKNIVDAIDKLQKENLLKMRIYAMLTPTEENLNHYLKKGKYKTDKLNVRSFKFYGDGALGSRGACLLNDYSDKPKWKGFLLSEQKYFEKYAELMYENGFQMNTHCIGDSALRFIIYTYALHPKIGYDTEGKIFKDIAKEKRWRIEHAQVADSADINLFKLAFIIPSVQPTHATSDMYWAEERLGKERVKYAYAYKDLLKAAGMVALGTDFPVEDISPFKTFYAAVVRKDSKGFPDKGFQMENALTREETIKGMTIWAAYSNFEEKEKGSLEKNKFADFVILDTDLMKCPENSILSTKVLTTYLGGERVH